MEIYYVRDPHKDIQLPSEPVRAETEWEPTNHLAERTKELKCLYRVFKILGRGGSPLDSMLQRVVDLVPSGWQFSEIAAARIKIEGKAYFSNPFFKENWLYLQILL